MAGYGYRTVKGEYTYKVENWDLLVKLDFDRGVKWLSRDFLCCGYQWRFKIQGKDITHDHFGSISWYLELANKGQSVLATCDLTITTCDGKHTISQMDDTISEYGPMIWGWNILWPWDPVTQHFRASSFVVMKIMMTTVEKTTSKRLVDPPNAQEFLKQDLKRLYDEKDAADIKFRLKDGELDAHRFILSMRSDFFAALFRSSMKETSDGIIEILDFSKLVVGEVLRYLYYGECDWELIDPCEVYGIAHRYGIQSLISQALFTLVQTLNVDNVSERLSFAFTFSEEKLKEECLNLMRQFFPSVVETKGYLNLRRTCPQAIVALLESDLEISKRRRLEEEKGEDGLTFTQKVKYDELMKELSNRGLEKNVLDKLAAHIGLNAGDQGLEKLAPPIDLTGAKTKGGRKRKLNP